MEYITFFEFILLSLAAFRLTRLIVFDTITASLRRPFHDIVEETSADGKVETYLQIKGEGVTFWIGELLSCYWCVGVWASILLLVTYSLFPFVIGPIVLILAIAALASIIEMFVSKQVA